MHTLDHLMWEAWKRTEGEQRFAELTGIRPSFGGQHESGTENSLLSLGQGRYLEIISPIHGHPEMSHLPKRPPPAFRPRLMTFGFKTEDLAFTKELVKREGLGLSNVQTISRLSPEGELLTWQTVRVEAHDFGHLIPFFTTFLGNAHPSVSSAQGCELLELRLGHPDPGRLQNLYDALEIKLHVAKAEQAKIIAVIATPKGIITLDNVVGVQAR